MVCSRYPYTSHQVKYSPAFETAATSAGSDIQDMPGRIRGYLHEKSEVIRVRIATEDEAAMMDKIVVIVEVAGKDFGSIDRRQS